jgi:GNAT superfamily N-acetyltransferase
MTDTPAVTVRPMREGDREAVIDLMHELNRFEDTLAGDRATDRAAAVRTVADGLSALAEKGGVVLLAEAGGAVAGMAVVMIEERPAFVRPERRRVAYVAELVVRESLRGRGIGRLLLGAAENWARGERLRDMGITVLAGNSTAHALYRSTGFQDYAVELMKRLR